MSSFPAIIAAVKTTLGLSSLVILAIVLVSSLTPATTGAQTYLIRAGSILILYLIALVFSYISDKKEPTFRVRISHVKEGVEAPWSGMCVQLLKNGKLDQEKRSDDDRYLFFKVKAGRRDDLAIIVIHPETKEPKLNPAPLYSEGQCMIPKRILPP